jgi:hypothetical protein
LTIRSLVPEKTTNGNGVDARATIFIPSQLADPSVCIGTGIGIDIADVVVFPIASIEDEVVASSFMAAESLAAARATLASNPAPATKAAAEAATTSRLARRATVGCPP